MAEEILILNKSKKRERYLILIFLILILVIIFIWGREFFQKVKLPTLTREKPRLEKIEIDFKILESPILGELQPFEEIKPFEEKIGRGNPFLPY